MRLCGNSITFQHYTAEEACQRLAAAGCNAVEMWPPHLEGSKTPLLLKQFREFAAELGLELWGYNAVGADYFQPFGAQENYDRTLAGLKADVDQALELGVYDVMVWEGVRPPDKDIPDADLLAVLVALFSEAIDYARPKGARFTAEPHPFTLGMDNDFHEADSVTSLIAIISVCFLTFVIMAWASRKPTWTRSPTWARGLNIFIIPIPMA